MAITTTAAKFVKTGDTLDYKPAAAVSAGAIIQTAYQQGNCKIESVQTVGDAALGVPAGKPENSSNLRQIRASDAVFAGDFYSRGCMDSIVSTVPGFCLKRNCSVANVIKLKEMKRKRTAHGFPWRALCPSRVEAVSRRSPALKD